MTDSDMKAAVFPVEPVMLRRFDPDGGVCWIMDALGHEWGIDRAGGETWIIYPDGQRQLEPRSPDRQRWIAQTLMRMREQVAEWETFNGVAALVMARSKLSRIRNAHRPQEGGGAGGISAGYCPECDITWPCPTYRMAAGFIDPVSGEWEPIDSYMEPDEGPWDDE